MNKHLTLSIRPRSRNPRLRHLLFFALILSFFGPHQSLQTADPITFPSHPRVAWTDAELEEWKNDPARAKSLAEAIARGETLLKEELYVPTKGGQWDFYYAHPTTGAPLEAKSLTEHWCPSTKTFHNDERTVAAYRTLLNDKLNRECIDLALAYALTGDDRFARPVREALLKLARIYPTLERHDRWGRTGLLAVVGGRRYCQNLSEGIGAIALAKAYDLIFSAPCMNEADRRAIEEKFLGATAREILRYGVFSGGKNNHRTWFNATFAVVGLAIGDESLINESLYGSSGLRTQINHSITDDGLWFEGANAYHFYALQAIIEHLDAVKRVGILLSGNSRLKSMWLGPASLTYPDGSIPVINDSDPANLNQYQCFFDWGARYFNDPGLSNLSGRSSGAGPATDAPRASTALRSAGLVFLRRGTGVQASCVVLDYGIHGDHHGHPDKLNITLFAQGMEIIPDPGRISYTVPEYTTWARTSVAHNTVIVNRQNQQPDDGTLLFFEEHESHAAALAESRGASPGRVLKRFLIHTGTFLVDVLTVEGRESATLDWIVHARGQISSGLPLEARSTPLAKGDGYPHLTGLKEGRLTGGGFFTVSLKEKGGSTGQLRILLLDEEETEIVTGTGIGVSLKEEVPFLLRSRKAKVSTFVTVYDLTPEGRGFGEIDLLPVTTEGKPLLRHEGLGMKITTDDALLTLALDLRSPSRGKIEVNGTSFTRLLLRKEARP